MAAPNLNLTQLVVNYSIIATIDFLGQRLNIYGAVTNNGADLRFYVFPALVPSRRSDGSVLFQDLPGGSIQVNLLVFNEQIQELAAATLSRLPQYVGQRIDSGSIHPLIPSVLMIRASFTRDPSSFQPHVETDYSRRTGGAPVPLVLIPRAGATPGGIQSDLNNMTLHYNVFSFSAH